MLSFVKTLLRWYFTIRGLTNSRAVDPASGGDGLHAERLERCCEDPRDVHLRAAHRRGDLELHRVKLVAQDEHRARDRRGRR